MNTTQFVLTIISLAIGYIIYPLTRYFDTSPQSSMIKALKAKDKMILYNLSGVVFNGLLSTYLFIYLNITNVYTGLLIIIVCSALLFLLIEDLFTYEISLLPVLSLVAFGILINLCVWSIIGNEVMLWEDSYFYSVNNLITGTVAALVIAIIYFITKGKGIGFGDVFLAAIVGLFLGWQKLFIAFYIIIISASIVGILLGVRRGKLKGTRIPFVPFIVIGSIITFLFWNNIYPVVSSYLPI
ncbi:prepilin peptidase [Candidatus Dojkabacteria bacterium]|uniref:Prepilin peptidase n=1 Tax=Candidatus Dojkabacteria bacterium TaxID=2099670 RepID=A0A955L4N4_9BACT|nr:prepilin peptidase [Candidatus Dojkabacteria bacterium]